MKIKQSFIALVVLCSCVFFATGSNATCMLSWPSSNAVFAYEHVDGNPLYNTIFRIVYASPEHNPPKVHQVWVDLNDDGLFATSNEIFEPNFQPANFMNVNYDDGELFTAYATIVATSNKTVQYKFHWTDTTDDLASGEPIDGINYINVTTFNYQPILSYSTSTNFTNSYVYPGALINQGTFTFRCRYSDAGNEAPQSAIVKIDINQDDIYQPTENFTLQPNDPADNNYVDSREYVYQLDLAVSSSALIKYFIEFSDGVYVASINESTISLLYTDYPHLEFVNSPDYTSSIVYPLVGNSGDLFRFRLNYVSATNYFPEVHNLLIDFDGSGSFNISEVVPMLASDENDLDYSDGKEFYAEVYLASNGINIGVPIMCRPYFSSEELNRVSGNASITVSIVVNYTQNKPLIVENNFPNPFGRSSDSITHFAYYLSDSIDVSIAIYNLSGQKVREFTLAAGSPGATQGYNYTQTWDGRDDSGDFVLNGVYVYIIKAGKNKEVKKMVFIR